MGKEVDYTKRPAEDFASLMIEFQTDDGQAEGVLFPEGGRRRLAGAAPYSLSVG